MDELLDLERNTKHIIDKNEDYNDMLTLLTEMKDIAEDHAIPIELSIDKGDREIAPSKIVVNIKMITD